MSDPSLLPTNLEEDRLARVALSAACEPGDLLVRGMLAQFGATQALDILSGGRHVPHRIAKLRESVQPRLRGLDPTRMLDQARRLGIRFVIPGDPEWPASVDDLEDVPDLQRRAGRPIGLWVRGPVRLDGLEQSVAVVGSRFATTYGAETAVNLAAGLARANRPVLSGLAYGIDYAAHRGALAAGGVTVAVLARGLDQPYPTAHRDMFDHLAAHHVLVSELPPGRSPTRLRFLARNRVIAALAGGTVVVEAAARSGALNTANWAGRLNRVLMGVPGPVTAGQSQGVHTLIRSGAAALVTGAADVLELVGGIGEDLAVEPRGPVRVRDGLDEVDQQVLEAVPVSSGASADSIARVAGVALADVTAALERMEQGGLVRRDTAGWRLAALAHQ